MNTALLHRPQEHPTLSTLKRLRIPALIACMCLAFSAQAESKRAIEIKRAPLDKALNSLASQAGVQILFASDVVANHQSTALKGNLSAKQALSQMLEGTNLVAKEQADGTFIIVKAPEVKTQVSPEQTLPEVVVMSETEKETATSHVNGYVAKRSATSSKMDLPILETARSISVVTSDQVEAQQPRSITEALSYTAGVTTPGSAFSVTDANIFLRGFSLYTNGTIYADGSLMGSRSNYNRTAAEPYGLERIEVLRGPASVTYGRNEPGGMVNLVSKMPSVTPIHEVQVQAGSFDRKQFALDLSDRIDDEGVWSYRLTALERKSDSQVEHAQDNRTYIAPALTWQPSDKTKVTLLSKYQKNEGLSNNTLPAVGTVFNNPNGNIPVSRNSGNLKQNHESYESTSIGYIWDQQLADNWGFRQNTRYTDFDGSRYSIRVDGYVPGQLRVIERRQWQIPVITGSLFTMDNQVHGKFALAGMEHTLLLGTDYHTGNATIKRLNSTTTDLDLYDPVYGSLAVGPYTGVTKDTDSQTGIYLQDSIKITPKWIASAGIRRDHAKVSSKDYLADTSQSNQYHATTGSAGLLYLTDMGVAPYVSYAESFAPEGGANFAGELFKPQEGKQVEVGVKYEPKGYNALFTAAVYDLKKSNVPTTDVAHPDFSIARGEIASRGLELEARAGITSNLNLIASYTYTDIKVTKSNDADRGMHIPGVPRNMASVWADYKMTGAFSGLKLAGGLRMLGETYGDYVESFKVPGYTLVDMSARYDLSKANASLKGAELAVSAKNLMDKRYAICDDITSCEYGSRRTVLGTMTYRW
ncbi:MULTISPECIES: TonB-dependent siderophore receptor [unclassified Methylophilus]|uniref:TonB-dependent siderophore receptor n=1 Tax=unclassified Methylophilus TaxID=2630143 RepID=UPI000376028C|nr:MULTISPECIES: TonB-dependent siderophore receptor [unclassified Methylophilus]